MSHEFLKKSKLENSKKYSLGYKKRCYLYRMDNYAHADHSILNDYKDRAKASFNQRIFMFIFMFIHSLSLDGQIYYLWWATASVSIIVVRTTAVRIHKSPIVHVPCHTTIVQDWHEDFSFEHKVVTCGDDGGGTCTPLCTSLLTGPDFHSLSLEGQRYDLC